MNESGWMALACTCIIQIIGIAFIYGQLTQRVKGHEHTLLRHDGELAEGRKTTLEHAGKIARIEGHLRLDTRDE